MCPFRLVLFSTDPDFIRIAAQAGVSEIIVDWECHGKEERQAFADTEINRHTVEDLKNVRAATNLPVLCRINPPGRKTAEEIALAIAAGADEVLLPMVRTVEEVERAGEQMAGRCRLGILVETRAALGVCEELGRLPLSRVYVGLNDLAIEQKTPNIFTALADGTVERIRGAITVPFGFGGVTLPERGFPIPCRLLIAEVVRLHCSFIFLRRSFYRDIAGRDLAVEVPRIHEAFRVAEQRSDDEVERDHRELLQTIARCPPSASGGRT